MGGAGNNPSIRLVEYDKTTGVVLNVEQYYLNLTQANAENQDTWELGYKATEYYGLQDFSTQALEYLTAELKDNDEAFDRYYKANGVFYDPDETWDFDTRLVHYCAISEARYERYDECWWAGSGAGIVRIPWLAYVAGLMLAVLVTGQ